METGSQKQTSSSLPIIGVLLLIAGAFYLSTSPLKSSRPDAPSGLVNAVPERDKIDARLWQDPLKVAMDHEKAAHSSGTNQAGTDATRCSSEHCVNQVCKRISDLVDAAEKKRAEDPNTGPADPDRPIVRVLLTIIRDGTFAEDHERRLRNRYAMLSALHLSGFVAEDSEHIHYFKLSWPDTDHRWKDIQSVRKLDETSPDMFEPLVVPFEWFRREKLYPYVGGKEAPGQDDNHDRYVAVVWLPEGAFSHRPLTRLALVIDALGHKSEVDVQFDVIGPSYSGTLRTMIDEIGDVNKLRSQSAELKADDNKQINGCDDTECRDWRIVDVNSMLEGLTIFSPWSTVSPALLVRDWPNQDPNDGSLSKLYEVIPEKFETIGMKFVRTIGSDDLLAMQLISELSRRRIDVMNKKDRMALICEWDTFYGKAFPLTFATMAESMKTGANRPGNWVDYAMKLHNKMADDQPFFRDNMNMYSYIRGIDGKLPGPQSADKEEKKGQEELESKWVYNKALELPIGTSQLDYVRRLAQKMDDDHNVTSRAMRGETLGAIGLVGSDVYDKLVMLHALREQFGDVILFMTDMDARLMHHEQFKWTRNVIVASNFGLRLNDQYQAAVYRQGKGAAPPFRDGYMTSLFFACRIALGLQKLPEAKKPNGNTDIILRNNPEEIRKLITSPRIFEIGRGRAVDLSVEDAPIHPERRRFQRWPFFLYVLVILTIVLLLYKVSSNVHKIIKGVKLKKTLEAMAKKETFIPWKWDSRKTGKNLLIGTVVVFVALALIDHYRLTGEPFSLVTGTSVWPGSTMRLSVIIISIMFITRIHIKLREVENNLGIEFKLETSSKNQNMSGHHPKKSIGNFSKETFSEVSDYWNLMKRAGEEESEIKSSKTVNAVHHWSIYCKRHKLRNHLVEMFAFIILFWFLLALLIMLFGRPNTPARGSLCFIVDALLAIFCVLFMLVLLFFVVNSTKLCLDLTNPLIERVTIWPWEKFEEFNNDSQLEPNEFADLLDVRFITKLTESVGKLIYYPFITVAIMIAARARYFDNWNFPYSLIFVYAIPLIYTISCTIGLQHAAKLSRQKALDNLRRKLFEARFGQTENRSRALKINRMIREIESIQKGAFRPFLQNPVIHVILGSGSAGLLAILKLFLSS
jgi:hypothetical protein